VKEKEALPYLKEHKKVPAKAHSEKGRVYSHQVERETISQQPRGGEKRGETWR